MEFSKNPIDAYPTEVLKWINLIKLTNRDDDQIKIIGSIAYRKLQQYADVDLIEILKVNQHFTPLIYYDILKKMCQRMIKNGALFSDMKLGFDLDIKKYDDYLGYLDSGLLKDFKPNDMINEMKNDPSFTSFELNLVKNVHDVKTWEELKEHIRVLYTFHWSHANILNGYIISKSGKRYDLLNLLFKPSGLKIDFFINIDDNWTEISIVHNIDINGEPINYFPINQYEIYKSIATNAEKFLYSPLFQSIYKGLKRTWILSRLRNDTHTASLLASLINSDVNNLYIAKSYLETIALMLLQGEQTINISKIKWLISHCTSIPFNLDELLREIDNCKNIIDYLHVKKELVMIVNTYAKQWIYKNHFESILSDYLGVVHIYKHKI